VQQFARERVANLAETTSDEGAPDLSAQDDHPALPTLWEVVHEHLDEAEFLFEQWDRGLASPELTLDRLRTGWEARLLAHVEGLVWNGSPAAKQVLAPALIDPEASPARVAAAAFARLSTPGPDGHAEVWAALREASAEGREGLIRALEIAADPRIDDAGREALAGGDAVMVVPALRVLAGRRVDPGGVLHAYLSSEDPAVLAAAVSAAAATPNRRDVEPLVGRALRHDAPVVRDAALDTAVVWGLPEGWKRCRELAEAAHPAALLYLALGGSDDEQDYDRVVRAAGNPEVRSATLWALGFSGRPSAAERCLALLGDDDEPTAAGAAEAFATVTGVPWRSQAALVRAPDAPAPDAEAGDLPEDLGVAPERELPLFDSKAVTRWWQDNRRRFDESLRYLDGQPLSPAGLRGALPGLSMRRRRGLLTGIAVATEGRWLPALSRLTADQQRLDARLADLWR
jgi:uncharacterized protein (TIGR02270 family)